MPIKTGKPKPSKAIKDEVSGRIIGAKYDNNKSSKKPIFTKKTKALKLEKIERNCISALTLFKQEFLFFLI